MRLIELGSEAIEAKVIHRDIKPSNILIDDDFNAEISGFGLAKLMGSGESHIATRVIGAFGRDSCSFLCYWSSVYVLSIIVNLFNKLLTGMFSSVMWHRSMLIQAC